VDESWKPPAPGALDDTPWPEQLTARVIDGGIDDDRMHGYAMLGDVAKHYRFSDTMYLALTGELPDATQSALFELALCAFATPHVGESPMHLAILVRVSGAPLASALATGLIAATDQARAIVSRHESLIVWLDGRSSAVPAEHRSEPPLAWVARLRDVIANHGLPSDVVHAELAKDAARLALLHAAGLRSSDQMEAAIVAARVGAIAAESIATGPQHLSAYPVKVPPYHYVEADILRK
jgi:hypothetical protein